MRKFFFRNNEIQEISSRMHAVRTLRTSKEAKRDNFYGLFIRYLQDERKVMNN